MPGGDRGTPAERRARARQSSDDSEDVVIDDMVYNSPTLNEMWRIVQRHDRSFEKMSDSLVEVVGRVELMRERFDALRSDYAGTAEDVVTLRDESTERRGEWKAIKNIILAFGALNTILAIVVALVVLFGHRGP